jgi:carbonic anhydrase/acetyltransferase-like protein (isoleucine patch superfamily)
MDELQRGRLEPVAGGGPLYKLDGVVPRVHPTAFIAPNAAVIGDVEIGPESGVWFGCVVRGDNDPITIGARSNIQDGAVLHSDSGSPLTIGADVTVGHRAILHGCTVADNALIGMGATVLNRARIGPNCIVGANALVTEGKEFPEFSLIVGSPAKVMRTLEPDTAEALRRSAEHYVANWRRFARGLRLVG